MSSAQLPRVTRGYSIGQCRSRTFHHDRKFYWAMFLLLSSFPPEAVFPTKEHLTISGDIFGITAGVAVVLMASRDSAELLQCPGQLLQWRVYWTKISIVLRLRNSTLQGRWTPVAPNSSSEVIKQFPPPRFQVAYVLDRIVVQSRIDLRLIQLNEKTCSKFHVPS